jgi:Lon protease-like protein
MRAGNATYLKPGDLPPVVPVFPLSGALLLPGGQMPLNIFEPRYLAMVDDALCGDRLIAMVQPRFGAQDQARQPGEPQLCDMGCVGRITAFQETGDGRYSINLTGVCRYRILREVDATRGYRRCEISPFLADLAGEDDGSAVDREALLAAFRRYLEANGMEADWDSVRRAGNETLVTALCMMSPYGPAEKQALLEAEDLKTRAETLIAITEIALARDSGESGSLIQ